MKHLYLIVMLQITGMVHAQTTLTKNMTVTGKNRSYRVYLPASFDGTQAVPLVFNFHGYGSNNTEQEAYGDFRPIADTVGFILVHPQGTDLGGGALGFNNFNTYSASNFDYDFVNAMLDSMQANYNINADRIYATGMSNGGFMSYDIACFLSHRFAAIASVTGSMMSSHLNACNPPYKLPVMQIHGTADATVAYDGTSATLTSTPIPDLVNFWANLHGCNMTPQTTTLPDVSTIDLSTVTHFVYSNANGSPVEHYRVENGGHTWPGSPFPIPGLVTNYDFSASKEIWRFFSQYSRANLAAVADESISEKFQLPNPLTDQFTFQWTGQDGAVWHLYNLQGQEVAIFGLQQGTNGFDLSGLASGIYQSRIESIEALPLRATLLKP